MTAHDAGGFTLIEMVVTLAIIGLLSTMVLPMAELAVQRGKEQDLHRALREIRTALDAYKQAVDDGRVVQSLEKTGYPPSLETLVQGVPDAGDPSGNGMIYFLRRIPRDPMFGDPVASDADTWGKRSYASSYDAPQEGNDVFDVYSQSDGIGLNGIAYRNW